MSLNKFLSILKCKIKILLYCRGKIQNNKLFVMTFDNDYNCNQKYIAEEILRQKLPIDIVWTASKEAINNDRFPKEIRTVVRTSSQMYKEQSTAKVWLDNGLSCLWYGIPKRREQKYINTWHGSMGIKKLGGSKEWLRLTEKCDSFTDYMVSNSTFEEGVYRETYWQNTQILPLGHPRNDILFDKEKLSEIRSEVGELLGIEKNKKILLYAPTFRDNGDTSCYNIDFTKLIDSLEQKFGGEWVVLVRMHYKNRWDESAFAETDRIRNVSSYPDMQKLMASADFGITDYSSWAYDYVLTRRPMVLYAPDMEDYAQGRGLYYPLSETPFPTAKNNEELNQAIASFDEKEYNLKIDDFLIARGCYEKGNAAKQVVEKIKEIMGIE